LDVVENDRESEMSFFYVSLSKKLR